MKSVKRNGAVKPTTAKPAANGVAKARSPLDAVIADHKAKMKAIHMEEFSIILDAVNMDRDRIVVSVFSEPELEKLRIAAGMHEQSVEDYVKTHAVQWTETDCEDLAHGLVKGKYQVVEVEAKAQ